MKDQPNRDFLANNILDGNGKRVVAVRANGIIVDVYDWLKCIIIMLAIAAVCMIFVFRQVTVEQTSMNDTLAAEERVLVTDMFYQPKDNDIVVISHGANYQKPIIKRVIAIEGQTLQLDYENDRIIVDGIEISEPYIKGTTFSNRYAEYTIPEVIPKGKIFVLGDNRPVSLDSRSATIGLIDIKDVIGKAQFVVYPFDHLRNLY